MEILLIKNGISTYQKWRFYFQKWNLYFSRMEILLFKNGSYFSKWKFLYYLKNEDFTFQNRNSTDFFLK